MQLRVWQVGQQWVMLAQCEDRTRVEFIGIVFGALHGHLALWRLGACGSLQKGLATAGPQDKVDFANACRAPWPCGGLLICDAQMRSWVPAPVRFMPSQHRHRR